MIYDLWNKELIRKQAQEVANVIQYPCRWMDGWTGHKQPGKGAHMFLWYFFLYYYFYHPTGYASLQASWLGAVYQSEIRSTNKLYINLQR